MIISTGYYLLRSPRFPQTKLFLLNEEINKGNITGIKSIFNDPIFLNAVYFSSRQFHRTVKSWLEDNNIDFDLKDRVFLSLYKYYIRTCTRSTPYGTFAGFSFGKISKDISRISYESAVYEPKIRIDIHALRKIRDNILSTGKNNNLYPNNTIYPIGERLRYIEWDRTFKYEISDIKNSALLRRILNESSKGATTDQIIEIIRDEVPDSTRDEARHFLDLLIANKVLVNNAPPYLLGSKDPLEGLINYLEKDNIEILKSLELAQKKLSWEVDVDKIELISESISEIVEKDDQLFQVDLKINLKNNQINERVIQKLIKDVDELGGLITVENFQRLSEFRNRFYEKFEDREVPLSEAIDPDIGIGYDKQISGNVESTPLIESIYFSGNSKNAKINIPPLLKLVLDKYSNSLEPSTGKVISITQEDVEMVSKSIDPRYIPDSSYIVGALISPSFEELDKGNFKFLSISSLPIANAGRILSRFTYYDEVAHQNVKNTLRRNYEDSIDAEIAHHPEDRTGNIMTRSNYFDYQIPYVSPNDPDINVIEISDIMVSVRGNEIILRSKRLNKIIKPHLTSTYNYSINTLAVFRFLCDLQNYNIYLGYKWDWSFLQDNHYLPRVEYKSLILSEARWKIEKNREFTIELLKIKITECSIPRFCSIKDGDNVLLLDTESSASLQLILIKLHKGNVYLFENINLADGNQLSNIGLDYNAEFIFPFVKKKDDALPKKNSSLHLEETKIDLQRNFFPGENWSYFKIYCSCTQGDKVLSILQNSLVKHFTKDGKELFFFFIRYADPHHHIRFRVRDVKLDIMLRSLNMALRSLTNSGLVTSVQIDTYKRELERYGNINMELSERIFCSDSEAIMKFIDLLPKADVETYRWKAAIISIDMMLNDFKIPVNQRIELFKGSYEIFEREFVDHQNDGMKRRFKLTINSKLREQRDFLDSVLRIKDYGKLEPYLLPFKERSISFSKISNEIKRNFDNPASFQDLLRSYMHMSLNRIFPSKARKHELIIYYFLYKSYTSINKRHARN